jgi:hypothetical protein
MFGGVDDTTIRYDLKALRDRCSILLAAPKTLARTYRKLEG